MDLSIKFVKEQLDAAGIQEENLEYRMKNTSSRGREGCGCRGFIRNKDTDRIVYIDTTTVGINGHIMYGIAASFADFPALKDMSYYKWCGKNEIGTSIRQMLTEEKENSFAEAVESLNDVGGNLSL